MSTPRIETTESIEEVNEESIEKCVINPVADESCSKSDDSKMSSSKDAPENDKDDLLKNPNCRKRKKSEDSEGSKVIKLHEGQDAHVSYKNSYKNKLKLSRVYQRLLNIAWFCFLINNSFNRT